ncbi:MAG: 5,10-methylenetetrahydromethanopterin reductase [Candidatus Bathyarchaeota archaeon BA1]|nr:MAG: 5,10-methylenetetrahydromethanopterin reductase [Candidatus Bathyarchaeota archaeon BA1]
MQFGVVLHVSATYANWDTFLTIAKQSEQLGYDSVWVSDHFISPSGRPYGLEAWTALSALASSTHKIRLGTYVLCNQFRHPSLLAKMASTLDNISEGRLELGIGAGWLRDEHIAFGFSWNKHSSRVERLRETIEIIKQLWTKNHVSYDGKYFQLKDATSEPKPSQKPHPPIWIGGNSEAIRRVVAEVGDGWIPVLPTPRQLADGVLQIEERMRHVGREPQRLQVAYGGSGCALIAESEDLVKRLAEPLIRSMGKPKEELACLIGTPEQCIQKIEQYQKAGAQKIVAGFYDFPSLKGLKLFAKSVIPHFK